MPQGLRKRGKTWWTDFRHDGKRIRESTGTSEEAEAERYRDELKARLWNTPRITGVSWEDAKTKWIEESPRPVQDILSLRLLDKFFPNQALNRCTAESFEVALTALTKERKWKPATYNRYLARIVAIANLSGFALKIQKKKTPKSSRMRVLTKTEWDRLYMQLPVHMKPMVKLALYTGLRQYNITHLRWDHVDLKREMLWVDGDEMKEEESIGIALADEAVAVLREQLGKNMEWVFHYRGKPITNINHAWHTAMERAGLGYYERWADGKGAHELWHGDFVWHGLRHTWASWQRVAGTPLSDIQALGGWRDPRSVARYAHVNADHLRRAAKNIKPWDRSHDSDSDLVTEGVTNSAK